MRLDTLGKPTLLQVVPEPKKVKGKGAPVPASEVNQVSKTAQESVSYEGEEKLGQIIEILARAKKENAKKKKKVVLVNVAGLVIQEYKRAEKYRQVEGRGSNVDVKG